MAQELFPDDLRILRRLAASGYTPKVIYDIGASNGIWTDIISQSLKGTQFHMFEPLADHISFYEADLKKRLQRMDGLVLHKIALGEKDEEVNIGIYGDGWGSSILASASNNSKVVKEVKVKKYALDGYVSSQDLPQPNLVKIDCQGFERPILHGGQKVIADADVLFMETWFQRAYSGENALISEIIVEANKLGFSLVELGERFFDEKHRLYSVDAFFFSERLLGQLDLSKLKQSEVGKKTWFARLKAPFERLQLK
jgi:FkbM family methyltransferase